MRTISVEYLSTMGLGVPAGSRMPTQPSGSKPGQPLSSSVGTWASSGARRSPVTASGFSLPAAMCWVAVLTSAQAQGTWPPSRSVSISAEPL
jgi:hypothetical protein